MLAFFNATVIKAILMLLTSLLLSCPKLVFTKIISVHPITRIIIQSSRDTTEVEETKDSGSERSERKRKKEKEKKPVSISITDKGIRLESGDEDRVIFEVDTDEISDAVRELEKLEGLPESLISRIGSEDGRRFIEVKGRDLVRFGESINVRRNQLVRGDVVAIFGDVTVEGKVMGDVVAIMGDIDLESSAIVNGEVVSILGTLSKDDDARVRGETVVVGGASVPFNYICPGYGLGMFGIIFRIIVFIIGILLLGIVIAFLPDRMKRSSNYVFGSFFKSLGIGALVLFIGSIVVIILAAIFSITIIGIPIAILIVFSFIALIVLGFFVSSLAVGRAVAKKFNVESESPYLHGLLGLFLLSVLSFISALMIFNPFMTPFRYLLKSLGFFLQLLAVLTGMGAFITSKAGALSKETKPQLPE